jgi:hypothetical protein
VYVISSAGAQSIVMQGVPLSFGALEYSTLSSGDQLGTDPLTLSSPRQVTAVVGVLDPVSPY